ncbi:uncharacterized protein LOC111197487 isoform X1 [Astyanax mexicanus]|uniref:uncharacterized protein LOC111197487 isoform X1 n=1 Tax=Astyanax mexicanus TaxID=7994 RepID=UPI0020CB373D|nr:uncharacterized protein LOC111197487 isoform X1 [Astyanax mexicanus]
MPQAEADFYSAKIYGNSSFKAGGKLVVKCSTFGKQTLGEVFVYLCKNGRVLQKSKTQQDFTFIIENITKNFTGNYSCVYSTREYDLNAVSRPGSELLFITVNESFVPAYLTVLEDGVKEGSDAEFKCSSLIRPYTDSDSRIYAYLCKNRTVIQVNVWNTEKNETIFILKNVKRADSGKYLCVLMADIQPLPNLIINGINEAEIWVMENAESENLTAVIVVGCCIVFLLFLSLGLWGIIQGGCFTCSEGRATEPTITSGGEILNHEILLENRTDAEWDEFSDDDQSARASQEEIYQNCPQQNSTKLNPPVSHRKDGIIPPSLLF